MASDHRTICLFCQNPLDGSDEHIIPKSINGRLRSSLLICSQCNAKFGQEIDPVAKKNFNMLLLSLGIGNPSSMQMNDINGDPYLLRKNQSIVPVKPEVTLHRDNTPGIRIKGKSKDVKSLMDKVTKRLKAIGLKPVFKEVENIPTIAALSVEHKITITEDLCLLLNKIALEFYYLKSTNLESVNDARLKVHNRDQEIKNVFFTNYNLEIREYDLGETSHIVKSEYKTKPFTLI